MSKATTKSKPMTFSAFVVTYAKAKNIDDVTRAGKQLRAKIRNAHGKNAAITKYVEGKGENRDGNRYPDVSPAVAKELLSL